MTQTKRLKRYILINKTEDKAELFDDIEEARSRGKLISKRGNTAILREYEE